jgi:transcriptional regulator with XRE-family HTH domain
MTLAQSIRHARQQAGLTQHELAEMACVSRSYIALIETGRRRAILEVLRVLGIEGKEK